MFGILAVVAETLLLVLEPAYRTYKELKNENTGLAPIQLSTVSGGSNNNNNAATNAVAVTPPQPQLQSSVAAADKGEQQQQRQLDERRCLLVHWIVYSAFRAVDGVTQPFLPFYGVVKIVAVVWLRAGGTEIIYRTIIMPFLAKNEPLADQWLNKYDQAKNTATTVTTEVVGMVTGTAAAAIAVAANKDAFDSEAE